MNSYPDLHPPPKPSVKQVSQPPPLAEAGWLERKRNGILVGKTLGGSSSLAYIGAASSMVGFLAGFWKKGLPQGRLLLLAVSSGVTGYLFRLGSAYFLKKNYFNDPEAQQEYRRWFFEHTVAEGLSQFTWDNIWKVVTPPEMGEKLRAELEHLGFHDSWELYSRTSMSNFVNFGLVSVASLLELFHRDVQSSNGKWNPVLVARLDKYADWLVEYLGATKENLRSLLMTDHQTLSMPFWDLVQNGAYNLFCQDLLTKEWMHHKFVEEQTSKNLTFDTISRRYRPWILDSGIVQPHELAPCFAFQMQQDDFVTINERYTDWPLRAYLETIVPDEFTRNKIRELQSQLRDFAETWETRRASVEENRNTKLAAHERTYLRSYEAAKTQLETSVRAADGSSESGKRAIADAKRLYEARCEEIAAQFDANKVSVNGDADGEIAKLQVAYNEQKTMTNKEWKQFLNQNRQFQQQLAHQAAPAPVNVTVVVAPLPVPSQPYAPQEPYPPFFHNPPSAPPQ